MVAQGTHPFRATFAASLRPLLSTSVSFFLFMPLFISSLSYFWTPTLRVEIRLKISRILTREGKARFPSLHRHPFLNEEISGEKSTTWCTGGKKKKGLEWPESWDKPRQKSFVNEVLGCWVYLLSQTRSSWVYLMSQFSTKTWVYLSSGLPFVPLPRQRYLRVKKKIAKNSIFCHRGRYLTFKKLLVVRHRFVAFQKLATLRCGKSSLSDYVHETYV